MTINRLLDDARLAARLGVVGRARSDERFGMDRFVQRTLDLYDRVRGVPSRRAA
jgi:hypothetical protein